MLFQLKEKNKFLQKNNNNFKKISNIISKVKSVAKNVIYMKNSLLSDDIDTALKSLEGKPKFNVEFSFGSYQVKTIRNSDSLMNNVKKLRFKIFFDEKNPNKIDSDEFDEECDHLVVIDKSKSKDYVVGTYRLLYRKSESIGVRFYSQSEFNITNILNKRSSLLEAGRSCVRKEYRDGRIIKLLWKGLATYIVKSKVEYIFGCASFPSSDHNRFLSQLSYLKHYHSPSEDLQTNPVDNLKAEFKVISKKKINNEKEFRSLPPLIKAYLRVGAYVGSGAVIDNNFDTTDVLIILDTKKLLKKYSNLSKGLTT